MNQRLKFVFLVIGFFVAANYFLLAAKSFFSVIIPSPAHGDTFSHPNYSDGLASINFNFFNRGGNGWNYVTQGYGRTSFANEYPGDWHDGIDIAASYGAPIYSPVSGTAIAIGNQDDYCYRRAFGKYVAIKNSDGKYVLWYAHLSGTNLSVGDTINAGQQIGTVGATGFETGTHLHFSIFDASTFTMQSRNGCGPEPTGQDEDPIPYIQKISNY